MCMPVRAPSRTWLVAWLTVGSFLAGPLGCQTDAQPGTAHSQRQAINETLAGAEDVHRLSIQAPGGGERRLVRFHSLGRDFSLQLRPNHELFSRDLVVERDGVVMTPTQAGLEPPLRGTVEGDPRSWVRMQIRDGAVEGLVFTQGALYEVRRNIADPLRRVMGRASISDYVEGGTGGQGHCGVVDSDPATGTESSGAASEDAPLRDYHACTAIGIHVISDYTHAAKLGGAPQSEAEMAMRMNEIDALYRSEMEYGFRVERVTSHGTQGGPGYNAPGLSINAQLSALTSWKRTNDAGRGVVHLFAGRVTSGAVGLAYVGSLCGNNATGVSNYLGANRGSTICAAHELGHNFGAGHDTTNGFVMQSSVNRMALHFSPRSIMAIRSHVGSRRCFAPCDTTPPMGGAGGAGGSGGAGGTGGRDAGGGGGRDAGTGGAAGGGGGGRGGGGRDASGSADTGAAGGGGGADAATGTGGASGSTGTGGTAGSAGGSSGGGGAAGAAGSGAPDASGIAGSGGPGTMGGSGPGPGAGTGGQSGAGSGTPDASDNTPPVTGGGLTNGGLTGGCSCRTGSPRDAGGDGFGALMVVAAIGAFSLRRRIRRR